LPYGKLQPFGERLQSPWATSEARRKARCARIIPIAQPKRSTDLLSWCFYFLCKISRRYAVGVVLYCFKKARLKVRRFENPDVSATLVTDNDSFFKSSMASKSLSEFI